MVKLQYFTVYSINLLRFISAHGSHHPLSKGVNKETGRTFWVYLLDEDLKKILETYSANKKK